MQLRNKVIGAAGIAALVAAGGFAFTANSTLPTDHAVGYGNVEATGINVDEITYTLDAQRETATAVVFHTDEDGIVFGDAQVKINAEAFAPCTAWSGDTTNLLTCPVPDSDGPGSGTAVNDLDTVALSYVSSTP